MGLRDMADEASGILRQVDERAAATGASPQQMAVAPDPGEMPDLSASGIPAEMDVPVHIAWSRVMGDVQWIGKERKTRDYQYRGIDDVMNVVAPVLRKHGVAVIPIGTVPTYTTINTKSGAAMNYCRLVSRFQVFGPAGDSFIGETPGEAFDNGDKASTKAQSVALRTFLLEALAIATNRPELDTEYGPQHELAGPPRPTAAEYHLMILSENTPLDRLQQIRDELDADPRMNHAVVEGLDGQPIELGRLVRRVGAARVAQQGNAKEGQA